jgi:hypothetical protein
MLPDDIEGLTPDLARRLLTSECDEMLLAYGQTFVTFSRLHAALGARWGGTDAPYIEEAIHDLKSASESMLTARPSYGQSNWDSLQAVEKVVKSCILEKKQAHKKIHQLADLFKLAETLGVPKVDASLIFQVQCSPSVRYDAGTVSKAKAFAAYTAALKICGDLAPTIRRTTANSTMNDYEFQLPDTKLRGLALRFTAPSPPFHL